MRPSFNLIGKRFGALSVIERHGSTRGERQWLCQCVCGSKILAKSSSLRYGLTKSCGRRCHAGGAFIGRRFGLLTVISRSLQRHKSRTGKHRNGLMWLCRCVCGNELTVLGELLRRGKKSCGDCLSKDLARRLTINITGKVYGSLLVLGPAADARNGARWRVRCTKCSAETVRKGTALRWQAGCGHCPYRQDATRNARIQRTLRYPHSSLEEVRSLLAMKRSTRKVEKWLIQTK